MRYDAQELITQSVKNVDTDTHALTKENVQSVWEDAPNVPIKLRRSAKFALAAQGALRKTGLNALLVRQALTFVSEGKVSYVCHSSSFEKLTMKFNVFLNVNGHAQTAPELKALME